MERCHGELPAPYYVPVILRLGGCHTGREAMVARLGDHALDNQEVPGGKGRVKEKPDMRKSDRLASLSRAVGKLRSILPWRL
ncbi:hypothetical protein RRG08_044138 [Elysia crispata]|uniref:Uncharacterized protein n=1 Tax=Elysia crispata TaxID=231223 RepID=A0AAE0Z7J6_9GAST|nr:hypothetical protein RRG08_044138 [Elysia crispata]